MTCWRRLRDWNRAGVWDKLHLVLLEELHQAVLGDLGPTPADATAGPRGGGPGAGVCHEQLAWELGEHAEHAEHRPSLRRGRVDALLDDVQPDPALGQQPEDEIELRAGRLRAAGGVDRLRGVERS
jgi:hypothetical protein